jgi:S-adenosylmethionine-diacylglycerol 3-amino-3-carboxypropyl transferase
VLVITSAGCNALDYALTGASVTAVDINYRQNALLELKIAAAKALPYKDFFQLFGRGIFRPIGELYRDQLRHSLSESAQRFWDRNWKTFLGSWRYPTFYYSGTSGLFARAVRIYTQLKPRLSRSLEELLHAGSLADQQNIYYRRAKPAFWNGFIKYMVEQDLALAALGVPAAQRKQIERFYGGGIGKFIEDCIDYVFGAMPLKGNYFWRVYLTGGYTPDCCPEYLKQENYEELQLRVPDRIAITTDTVTGALRAAEEPFSHVVLLDHMDWLASHDPKGLRDEWDALLCQGRKGGRIIWRSGALTVDYVDPIPVFRDQRSSTVGEHLYYDTTLAAQLHQEDRVHTYGSFSIATIR